MPFQILVNLIIALTWMYLNAEWTPISFCIGYVIGLVLLFLLRRFLTDKFYAFRLWALLKLLLIFLKELVISSVSVAKLVLKPNLDMKPGIFALKTELKTDWEITTLACLITLTPGTLTLDISPKGDILYIHALDVPDVEEAIQGIKNSFEKAIMEVSR